MGGKSWFGLQILDSSGWSFPGEKEAHQIKVPQIYPNIDEYPDRRARHLKKLINNLGNKSYFGQELTMWNLHHYKWHFILEN